jgi:hypothetical protein
LNQFKAASQHTGLELQHAGAQTDAQVSAAFAQLAARWQAALTKLETLQVPPQFSAAATKLKVEVQKVRADLAAIAAAAQSHNAAAARQATTKLVNDILSAKQTSTTINK